MSVVAAAVVPSPPLLARELTGGAVVLPDLRAACLAAVGRLLAAGPDLVAVVGGGPATQAWEPDARLRAAAFAPQLGPRAGQAVKVAAGKPGLPLAAGIGAMLLDEAGYTGSRALLAVDALGAPAECIAAGAALAALAPGVALLAVGDGSARRTLTAPGYLDERAAPFDALVEGAFRAGDMAALAALDAALATELMATGRAAWQALAGAVGPERRVPAEVLYAGLPYGVTYLVAVMDARPARPGLAS
ncbi:MAG TPA: hypothetical protein VH478_15800 [Trebonia sp.]|jgi:hypothetical protein|nr:hypothetical protein [Trebonia sp.]